MQHTVELRSASPEEKRWAYAMQQITLLEQIEDLFRGIGEDIGLEEGPIRLARLSVACARAVLILASAVDGLAAKCDGLNHPTYSIVPIEGKARFADLNAQLAEMTNRVKNLSNEMN
jgi:hypothetical protein